MDERTRDPVTYVMLATGTGYNTNSFKFDVAFQLRWARYQVTEPAEVRSQLGVAPEALGTTSARERRIKFSGIYRITDTAKLLNVFQRIFVRG